MYLSSLYSGTELDLDSAILVVTIKVSLRSVLRIVGESNQPEERERFGSDLSDTGGGRIRRTAREGSGIGLRMELVRTLGGGFGLTG